MSRAARSAAAALALAAAAPALPLELPMVERTVEVAAPGVVRVALPAGDVPIVADDLVVTGPDGRPVPHRLLRLPVAPTLRAATVSEVTRQGEGWRLTLDLGPAPGEHHALLFALDEQGIAERVTLWGAAGPEEDWRQIAQGPLFRLGEDGSLQRPRLAYPPSRDTRLRVEWPTAELPELSSVAVEVVAAPLEAIDLPPWRCGDGDASVDCRLAVPATGRRAHQLVARVAAAGDLAWRLLAPRSGAWREVGSGRLPGDGERDLVLPAAADGEAVTLRLQLWAARGRPELAASRLLVEAVLVELTARSAGVYRLVGSPFLPRTGGAEGQAPPDGDALWLEASAQRPTAGQPLPIAPSPLPEMAAPRSWPLAADASPGDLARLVLPTAVEAAAGEDLRRLRIGSGDRQVPWVAVGEEEPVLVAAARAAPAGLGEAGGSGLRLPLAEALPAGGGVSLEAPPATFSRPVRLVVPGTALPGAPPTPVLDSGWLAWECRARPPLPCRLDLDLPPLPAESVIELALDDGENPPLPLLAVEVVRPAQAVLFPWPEGEPPRLLLAELPRPRYDLALLAPALGRLPAAAVTLGEAREDGEPRWQRFALFAAMAAAGVVLLLVLARTLRQPAE